MNFVTDTFLNISQNFQNNFHLGQELSALFSNISLKKIWPRQTWRNFLFSLICHVNFWKMCLKVQSGLGLQLYQKETLAQVFSCEFSEICKSTFFTENLWATASVVNSYIRTVTIQVQTISQANPIAYLEAYLKLCQTSKIVRFAKVVNSFVES